MWINLPSSVHPGNIFCAVPPVNNSHSIHVILHFGRSKLWHRTLTVVPWTLAARLHIQAPGLTAPSCSWWTCSHATQSYQVRVCLLSTAPNCSPILLLMVSRFPPQWGWKVCWWAGPCQQLHLPLFIAIWRVGFGGINYSCQFLIQGNCSAHSGRMVCSAGD